MRRMANDACVFLNLCVGVGRFRNEMYCEFLKSLNASRNLRTSIGPPEVRHVLYAYMYTCERRV